MQIDSAELLLVSFSFVLTLYGINSSGRGSNTVLCTIAFQEPSDSAYGELSSGIITIVFSSKTSCGKFGENSRLDIATTTTDYYAPVNGMPQYPPPAPSRGILGDLTMIISIAPGSEQYLKSNPLFST